MAEDAPMANDAPQAPRRSRPLRGPRPYCNPHDQSPSSPKRRQRCRGATNGGGNRPARGRFRGMDRHRHRAPARAFCAGADLKEIAAGNALDRSLHEAGRVCRARRARPDQAAHRRRQRPRRGRRLRDHAVVRHGRGGRRRHDRGARSQAQPGGGSGGSVAPAHGRLARQRPRRWRSPATRSRRSRR